MADLRIPEFACQNEGQPPPCAFVMLWRGVHPHVAKDFKALMDFQGKRLPDGLGSIPSLHANF